MRRSSTEFKARTCLRGRRRNPSRKRKRGGQPREIMHRISHSWKRRMGRKGTDNHGEANAGQIRTLRTPLQNLEIQARICLGRGAGWRRTCSSRNEKQSLELEDENARLEKALNKTVARSIATFEEFCKSVAKRPKMGAVWKDEPKLCFLNKRIAL